MAPIQTLIASEGRLPRPEAHPSNDELFRLGLRHATGQDGEAVDLVLAHTLFSLAALHGSIEAMIYCKKLAGEIDPADVTESNQSARAWLARARHDCQSPTDKVWPGRG
ncbi:MAG TPA: sel1 repeat family protein [Caulobacteraceae bacterium]|jgi:TPR repeat protein